ncbi:type IV secretion system protein [Vibrio sp. 10N.261.46.A3]|uniref:type IV secretion system protein n=1 Tax=Vibrio sp. 10N.261.46.A3 TaxID=3229658 RepID=UPI00354EB2F1
MDRPMDESFTKQYVVRLLSIVIVALIGLTLTFAYLYVEEFKKKQKTEYQFVTLDNANNQLVKLEIGGLPIEKQDLLRESVLREYVKDYFTINHVDEPFRYQRIRSRSSKRVFSEFQSLMSQTKTDERGREVVNKSSPLNNEDYFAEIEVIRSVKVASNRLSIYFTKKETLKGEPLPVQRWVAILSYEYRDLDFEYKDIFLNIDGLTVTQVLVQEESKL